MNPLFAKRWLAASVALNLFLACGIGAGTWRWWKAERAVTPASTAAAPQRGLRFAADELPADLRRTYRLGLRDARRDSAAQIQTAREGRQEVLQLLTATAYDRSAVAAALARTREADLALRARMEASVFDFAAALPPEQRQKLAEGLVRRGPLRQPEAPASGLQNTPPRPPATTP